MGLLERGHGLRRRATRARRSSSGATNDQVKAAHHSHHHSHSVSHVAALSMDSSPSVTSASASAAASISPHVSNATGGSTRRSVDHRTSFVQTRPRGEDRDVDCAVSTDAFSPESDD